MKKYRVLTHYVVMETFEILEKELKTLEPSVKNYPLKEKLKMLCREEYKVNEGTRDFEVVDIEQIND